MFHQFKITSYAIILCLFGLTPMTVSPVFADDSAAFVACQEIGRKPIAKGKCFRDLAESLQAELAAGEMVSIDVGKSGVGAEPIIEEVWTVMLPVTFICTSSVSGPHR